MLPAGIATYRSRRRALPNDTEGCQHVTLEHHGETATDQRVAAQLSAAWPGAERVRFRCVSEGAPHLADATSKWLGVAGRRPAAFAVVSSRASPMLVARGAARAREVAQVVGPAAARAVAQPVATGALLDGRSFMVSPFFTALPRGRLLDRITFPLLRPHVYSWLAELAVHSAAPPSAEHTSRTERELLGLVGLADLPDEIAIRARVALRRLRDGRYVPRAVITHGDLWPGNIMFAPEPREVPWVHRFVVIDWAGAELDGHPFMDLVRSVLNLRVGGRAARQVFGRYADAMQVSAQSASDHLVAGLARGLATLEHFPLRSFRLLSHEMVMTLARAGL